MEVNGIMPASGAEEAALGLLIRLSAVVILVGLTTAVLAYMRKRLRNGSTLTPCTGFTLDDLRRLHERGDLDADEFNTLRRNLLGLPSGATDGKRHSKRTNGFSSGKIRDDMPSSAHRDVES